MIFILLSISFFFIESSNEINNPLKWQLFHSDTYKATTADVYYRDHLINQKYFIFRLDFNSPYTEIGCRENCPNVNGQFIFENMIINQPIFYTNTINENYENDDLNSIIGLSFPKNEMEEKTNFLTNLKNQNIIETKIFSLTKSNEDSQKINILFGTIPKIDINTNKKRFLLCPMLNKKFECNFKNILIANNKDYPVQNAKIKFSLDERYIICPLKFLNYLENTLLKEDKEVSDKCQITLINELSYSIVCKDESFKKLNDIKIIFEDLSEIIFEVKNLFFERKDKTYQFIMTSYKDDKDDNNNFIFGYNFFTIYDGVIDLDKEVLGIYHDKYINNININNSILYPIEIKNINYNSFIKNAVIYLMVLIILIQIIIIKCNKKENIKNDELLNGVELEEKI